MILFNVYNNDEHWGALYDLLAERKPEESISHKAMPSLENHFKFVASKPYKAWYYIIGEEGEIVGSIYLTEAREIGIGIFKKFRRRGYAIDAIKRLMEMYPGRFLANINPANSASIKLFSRIGCTHIQNTYELKQ